MAEKEKEVVLKGGEVKKFSEIYTGSVATIAGERKESKDVIDKEIIIKNFVLLNGTYGEFAIIEAEMEGQAINFGIGSDVVIHQLKRAKEDNNLPLRATITSKRSEKSKRNYFTLS